jgi:hypothetical protein
VTLTIPAGKALDGSLFVISPDFQYEDFGGDGLYYDEYDGDDQGVSGPPTTLADVVKQLDAQYANNDLLVAYDPEGDGDLYDYYDETGMPWSPESVGPVVVDTSEFLMGGVEKDCATLRLFVRPTHVTAGRGVTVAGWLLGTDVHSGTVSIYARRAGTATDTLIDTLKLRRVGGPPSFAGLLPALEHDCTITAVWSGNDEYLAASDAHAVAVSPRVALTIGGKGSSLLLTATTSPSCKGVIAFVEMGTHGQTALLKTARLAGGRARVTWSAPAGTHRVEAIYRGSTLNAAGVSRAVTVSVP